MADKRITDLPELIQADSGDYIPIVDSSMNVTKKVAAERVLAPSAVDTQNIIDGAVTSEKMSTDIVPANTVVQYGPFHYAYYSDGTVNLNNIRDTGYYIFESTVTINNIPGGVNGFMHVISSYQADVTARVTKQIWYRWGSIDGNDHDTWIRTANTSTNWGNWRKVSVL